MVPLRSQEPAPTGTFTPHVGDQVELRCVGPNGVFEHPATGDDFVAVVPFDAAAQPEQIEASIKVLAAFYKYFGASPTDQRCRFYRTPPPEAEPPSG